MTEAVQLVSEADAATARGDLPKAIGLLERAAGLQSDDFSLFLKLAGLRRAGGQPSKALESVHRALAIEPRDFTALLMRASLLDQLGMADAGEAWSHALVQQPDGDPPAHLADVIEKGRARAADWAAARESKFQAVMADAVESADAEERRRLERFRSNSARRTKAYHSSPTQFHFPELTEREFHPRRLFPWIDRLEQHTDAIAEELHALMSAERTELVPYIQYPDHLPLDQWKELNRSRDWTAIHLLQNGQRIEANARHCPVTLELVAGCDQPHIGRTSPNAMFSLLAPQTAIPPHTGVSNTRLVCHLPLIVPPGCWFRVGEQRLEWARGEAFVFDDTIEHEAMNPSDELRVVLIFDIWNPELSAVERDGITALIASDETEEFGRLVTSFERLWADARSAPFDVDFLDSLARAALAEGEEERALELIEPAAQRIQTVLMWRWVGVLQRSLARHAEAFAAFIEAERKDSSDVSIAHSLAQVALEAGWDAVGYFERAIGLGPPKSELLLGLAAARFARGEGELAASDIEAILAQSPFWLDGHRQLAQLRSVLGEPERASESLERAIAQHPSEERLWVTLLNLDLTSSRFADLQRNVARAKAAGASSLDSFEAIAASELGEVERADELFELPDAPLIWKVRHLLRTGRFSQSLPLIDAAIAEGGSNAIWPYALAAWRAAGDPRLEWLIGKDAFVSVVDLSASLPFLDQLIESLRSLHQLSGQFLDQSVKGGTQTDGPLLSRTQPEFRQLRDVILAAVDKYAAQLPKPDPSHPLLRQRRDRPFRFAGSWSVRLKDGGYHESHVHNSGWVSSALYLALPDGQSGDGADQGMLELGAPPKALKLDQSPLREIEPAVGRLVLFPSWLWHGTRPFQTGERLTIAFDVKLSH